MTSASVVETLKKAHPRAHVYGLASTGEVVIERGGRKRGRANITVLSQAEALQQARQLAPSGPAAISAKVKAKVVHSLIQFFEMQQVVWLHLEECAPQVTPGPIEDATYSNSDPEEDYPFVGTEDVPATHTEEVVSPVEVITELKQEAGRVVRARVIEFRAAALAGTTFRRTFTRVVRKADKAAFAAIKADIKTAAQDGVFQTTLQEIIPSLRVRPGYVYVRV